MKEITNSNEIKSGKRFAFGQNWSRFLNNLDEDHIKLAKQSLCKMLKVQNLEGKSFLDIGSGSGLFSLAARQLGASVHSFDFDPQSVNCTKELKRRYYTDDPSWVIEEGSVLDQDYMRNLKKFDIVYSWGVLHHTGDMYKAFENTIPQVLPHGKLFIAIYNHQQLATKYWRTVKKYYNKNIFLRFLIILIHFPYLFLLRWIVRFLTDRLSVRRGMSLWYDMLDWLGGYPFETAKPEEIISYFHKKDFCIESLTTCGGRMGCNEFVFVK